jgi:hypothetical protein
MPPRTRHILASLLAALAVSLVTTVPAVAATAPPDWTPSAQQIAVGYWGTTPCQGQVGFEFAQLPPGIRGWSMWSNPVSATGNPELNENCRVSFATDGTWDWPSFCTAMVHEYGHLLGHEHGQDPNDVMYPYYVKPVAACAPAAAIAPHAPAPRPKARPKARHHRRHRRHRKHRRHRHARRHHAAKRAAR